jgi:hypothetical protein
MATTTTVESKFVGKVAADYYLRAFKEEDTLRLGLIEVVTGINYKYILKKMESALGTVDYYCGFAPAGSLTLSEKDIITKKFKNDIQLCKEDFRPTWSGDLEGDSAHNDRMPEDILRFMIADLLAQQAVKVERDIWNGTDVPGSFAGFVTQWNADAGIIKANNGIVAGGAAITEANVEAELKKVLKAIPRALRRLDVTVLVSADVFQAYNFYLISKGISNDGNTEEKQVRFGKYTLTEVNGLEDNTIIVYQKRNLVMVTGLTDDLMRLEFVDEDSIGLMTGQVRGKMVYNAAVGYNEPTEIIHYVSTITA